ncbi:MAG: response regulator [Candidatus Pacebacteria bacterium]|nr:response regulator [Candidatus Paceibacterota bacterium]
MKKVLLVEDEGLLARMYTEKLSQAGLKIITAIEAELGLELAKRERPDLIILDILLPKENGIFFLQKLREDPKIASIPVLAFSNYDDPTTKKQAFSLGIIDYLIKTNYTPNEMVEKVKKCLK